MKNFLLACICILLLLPATLWGKRIVKVACVGNSITYGAGISNRDKNSYPAQLQYYLGDGYEVHNFGSNGATAQSDGDYPYIRTAVYNESKAFFPSRKEPASVIRRQCDRIYELLGSHAFDKRVTYTNPTGWFLDERGVIRDGLYGGDYIHLTENGYACVASHLIELMK